MTLPTNIQLPIQTERILSDNPQDREKYVRDLIFTLQRMYEDIAQAVNGDIRGSVLDTNSNWTPTLDGATPGTFTYNHQIGWVYRQGIFVDVWFDVSWSAVGTAAGNLILNLPYEVAMSSEKPFVGTVQSSAITYSGGTGIVVNAIQSSYEAEFWNVGSGFTTANQSVVSSGQLIGHVRYIGKSDGQ